MNTVFSKSGVQADGQTALVQLMKEKPITKITVKELCERANISRPTFCQYYTDIFDLADKTENAFIELLIQKSDSIKKGLRGY